MNREEADKFAKIVFDYLRARDDELDEEGNIANVVMEVHTILLTLLASGWAVGLPPILLMLFPSKIGEKSLNLLWLLCRLIPIPFLALLFL